MDANLTPLPGNPDASVGLAVLAVLPAMTGMRRLATRLRQARGVRF